MPQILRYLLTMLWGAVAALAAYLCLRPWRRKRLTDRGLVSPALREAALCLFWMFCGGMALLTLTPRWTVSSFVDMFHGYPWNAGQQPFFRWGSYNLSPLRTFRQDKLILLGNLAMFIPFGFFTALLWRGWSRRRALLTGFAITAFVECWQLLVGRAFDIDDLLLNTLGVYCGHLLWRLLRRIRPKLTEKFHCQGQEYDKSEYSHD